MLADKKIFISVVCCFVLCAVLFLAGFMLFKNKTVEIVFTTDNNYKDYLITTLKSAIANKNKNSIYNIHILCVDLSEKDMEKFKQLSAHNVNIYPINLSLNLIRGVGNYEINYSVTRADLFKFFMPQLFPDLDKILYIDVDTVIMKDLTGLYNTNLGNKYLGAVNKCIPEKKKKSKFLWFKYKKNLYNYNCGVLLFNLKKFRQDGITEKLVVAKNSGKYKDLMTQQVFNAVLGQDKIVKLSPVYNTLVQWNQEMFEYCHFRQAFWKYCINIKSSEDLFKKAVIIHYVEDNKPWDKNSSPFAYLWEKYKN